MAKCITVTHFINPHLFWYHEVPSETYGEVLDLEKQLDQIDRQNVRKPTVGTLVAVQYLSWKKLIRARLDHIATFSNVHGGQYIMWAIDYGFPFQTKVDYIFQLPQEFKKEIDHVRLGGLVNIWPAEKYFDFKLNRAQTRKTEKWSKIACDSLEKLLNEAETIEFVERFSASKHSWGELHLSTHMGEKYNIRHYLIEMSIGNAVKNFREMFVQLSTTEISPWMTNDGNTRFNENKAIHYPCSSKTNVQSDCPENMEAQRKVDDWRARNAEIRQKFLKSDHHDDVQKDMIKTRMTSLASSTSATSHGSRVPSERLQLIEEERKKLGTQKSLETLMANESSQTIPSPTQREKRKEVDSSVPRLLSDRLSQIMEERRKGALGSLHEVNGNSVGLHSNNENMENIQKTKLKNQRSQPDNRKKGEIKASAINLSKGQSNAREMRSKSHHASLNTSGAKQETSIAGRFEPSMEQSNREHTRRSSDKDQQSNAKDNSSSPFDTIRMIPAGYDLSNLTKYKNEEKHWHRKKSTLHDHIPHDDISLLNTSEVLKIPGKNLKTSQRKFGNERNFRNTRPHNDKKKEFKNEEETSIMDTTITTLKEKPISFTITNNDSRNSSYTPLIDTQKSNNRDALKPPFTQIKSNENKSANTEISQLENLNSSETKLDPNISTFNSVLQNNEPATNGNVKSVIDGSTKFSFFKHHSNKSRISQKEHLKRLEDRLTKENVSFNNDSLNRFRSPLMKPEEGYNRDELKPSFTEISNSNENQHGNKDVADLGNLSSNTSKLDPNRSTFNLISQDKESAPSDNINSIINESKNYSAFTYRSNKSPKVQKQYLKSLDERLSSELINPPQNTYKIKLPQTQELRVIKGECALKPPYMQDLVLAHSKVGLDIIEKPTDATFFKEIFDEMSNLKVTKLYRLQSYSWPHLLRGNSLFIVNPPKSGKTWSYLPAICNLVTYYVQNYTSTNMYGPMGIVLVPSSSHVEKINHYCKCLLHRFKTPVTTVASFGVRNVNEVKISLLDSCGLLIATPASFLRILEYNEKEPLIDFKRIRHLVIDDMDLMMTGSKNEFEEVMKTLFKMCRHVNARNQKVLNFQLVVTSRVWDSMMLAMLRKSNQPLLLIGDFLEAAVYGKATLSIKLCANEKKIETIMQFIEENSLESKRMLILCNSDDDVSQVTTGLKASNYMCIGCNSDTSVEELIIADEWKKEKVATSRIFVCTDAIFSQIKIQNVHYLIHYSMSTTWTKFTARFSAFAQTYKNHVKNNFEATTKTTEENSQSLILLDEENSLQLPRLMEFMEKHNQMKYIHKDILAVSKRVLLANEEARLKKGVGVCPLLLEFGECDTRCHYRHNLSSFDVFSETDEIPSNGDIRILILKVFSPTHYSARLLQHRRTGSTDWQDIRHSNEVCKFGMQMNLHYSNQDNLILQWPLHIGDLCVYKDRGNFQRATILEVPEILSIDIIKTVHVTVKLIDQGSILPKIKSDSLFVCQEKFKQFPAQAVDIRLLGIVPFDNEQTWDSSATKSVQHWLINNIKKKDCIHANIDFALANTIWVKNVIVMEPLPTVGQYIYRINVKRSLVEKNIGAITKTKNSKIKNMAEECGLLIKNEEDIESEKELVSSCESDTSSLIKFSSNNETMQSENFILSTNKVNETKPPSTGAIIEKTNNEEEDWDKSLMNDTNRNKEIFDPLPKDMEEKDKVDGSSVDKIASDIKEEWFKLPLFEIVKVEIGDENENGNWKNVFLQCVENEQMNKFIQLLAITKEHISKLIDTPVRPFSASWFKPMQNCIVHYDNRYLRAKLYGIFGSVNNSSCIYRFFLCDYACFVIAKNNELYNNFLYPTTKEIIEFMPYQAIHCTLTGIHLDKFAKQYKVTKDYLFAYAVCENENRTINTTNFNINSFEIILFENKAETDLSTMEMVNTALVQNDAATLNNNTKHYLDLEIGIVKNEIQNENDLCNFADFIDCYQRALELEAEEHQSPTGQEHEKMRKALEETKALCATLKKQIQPIDYTNIALNDSSTTKENIEIVPEKKNHTNRSACINDEQPLCSISSSHREPSLNLPPLKLLRKRSKTTWYDTEYLIFLTIHAPDIKDYYLEVSTNTLLFAAKAQEEEYVLVLNFLFSVEPQLVSHELRGLNVTVRLVKSVYTKWPRLLKQTTKYPWLQYNLNAINIAEMDRILPQQQIDSILLRNEQFIANSNDNGSDEESDGEENLFQTFPRIVNSEDVHDPAEEIF